MYDYGYQEKALMNLRDSVKDVVKMQDYSSNPDLLFSTILDLIFRSIEDEQNERGSIFISKEGINSFTYKISIRE